MTAPDQRQAQIVAAVNTAALVTTAMTAATTQVIQALWQRINPYNPKQVRDFVAQAGRIIVSSQKTVGTAHIAAQQVQLRALGINRPVTVTIPDNVRGSTVTLGGREPKVHPKEATVDYADGVQDIPKADGTAAKVFGRAAETYRYERSIGKDEATANNAAVQRISSIVDDNLILSARLAAQQTLMRVAEKDERIIGYRRVIHPDLSKGGVCGLCIAASDRVYHLKELQPIHKRCNCTIAPITSAHDPGQQLNQDDLDRLYSHAQDAAPNERATSGAALKRTRYQIVHHDELGPVLTRVTGQTVPYASVTPPATAA